MISPALMENSVLVTLPAVRQPAGMIAVLILTLCVVLTRIFAVRMVTPAVLQRVVIVAVPGLILCVVLT